MGLLSKFFKSLSPQATQERYSNAYRAVSGSQPPPKRMNAPTYHLHHWAISKHQNGTATIHLHGEHWGKKHIEYVPLAFLPGETDQELIRCAAWISPNKWHIEMGVNISQFGGKFNAALDDRLRSTLPEQSQISSSGDV
jgi:hypothetical protein